MTPHDAKGTLDRLWDDVPVGAAPIDELVRGGMSMRRRARLRAAGAAAALTLAVVAGSAVAANTVLDGASPRPDGEVPAAAADAPTAPAGQRLVGAGRAVVAVPAGWNGYGLKGCEPDTRDTIWFEVASPGADLDCPSVAYPSPTVKISTLDSDGGKEARKFATQPRVVDGVEVFRELVACPDDAFCIGNTAVRFVVVPSENVAFTISGPMDAHKTLDAIAESVQILPEGYATVPFVDGNNVAAWKTAIVDSGLVPDGDLPECEDVVTSQPGVAASAICDTYPPIRPDPAPGTVVALGATVTLFPPTSTTLRLPCDESEQKVAQWDVSGPGQPTPIEAVAPHSGGLTLVEQEIDGETTVFGLRADGSVFREFQVSKHDDGWWPDGYRECSG